MWATDPLGLLTRWQDLMSVLGRFSSSWFSVAVIPAKPGIPAHRGRALEAFLYSLLGDTGHDCSFNGGNLVVMSLEYGLVDIHISTSWVIVFRDAKRLFGNVRLKPGAPT